MGGTTVPIAGAIAPIAGRVGNAGGAGSSAGGAGSSAGGSVATAGAGGVGAAGGGAGGAGGGGGSGGSGARTYAPTFSAIYSEIFLNSNYNCNLGACHIGSSMNVTDNAATTYMNLIDVAASKVADASLPATCGSSGKKLIVPNKPDESLLLLKVKDAPPCGARMRLNGPYLDDREIQQITKWIEMGAPNN
jgi:hypothetical protein